MRELVGDAGVGAGRVGWSGEAYDLMRRGPAPRAGAGSGGTTPSRSRARGGEHGTGALRAPPCSPVKLERAWRALAPGPRAACARARSQRRPAPRQVGEPGRSERRGGRCTQRGRMCTSGEVYTFVENVYIGRDALRCARSGQACAPDGSVGRSPPDRAQGAERVSTGLGGAGRVGHARRWGAPRGSFRGVDVDSSSERQSRRRRRQPSPLPSTVAVAVAVAEVSARAPEASRSALVARGGARGGSRRSPRRRGRGRRCRG